MYAAIPWLAAESGIAGVIGHRLGSRCVLVSLPAGVPAATAAETAAPVVVTLPTGDSIAVTDPGGRQEASLLPGSPDRQFAEFNLGGDLYVVPEAALHGGNPDLAQFDVTRLAAGQPGILQFPRRQ